MLKFQFRIIRIWESLDLISIWQMAPRNGNGAEERSGDNGFSNESLQTNRSFYNSIIQHDAPDAITP